MSLEEFVQKLPKAQLHLHIEGTLQPELLMKLAAKNKVPIKYQSIEEIRNAYSFNNLQQFLDIYYQGMSVLQTQEDFFELADQYIQNCRKNNIVHAEVFFDPEGHLQRGISFETLFNGIYKAFENAAKQGNFTFNLIMCFLRHLPQETSFKTLQLALPFKDKIIGVGLDSTEVGNPPSKHKNVFAKAKEYGFRLVAHCGEQGPFEYIWESLKVLHIERIDHGVRCIGCKDLMAYLRDKKIGLTVCPLSNIKLRVFKSLEQSNLKILLNEGLLVTINSDDPAYFGGYVNENFIQSAKALNLSEEELKVLVSNSFRISFLPQQQKNFWIEAIDKM